MSADRASGNSPVATLATLRRLLIGILLFGFAGTATELLLIGHDEDVWQLIPLGALFLAIVPALAVALSRAVVFGRAVRLFRVGMVALILAGGMGSVLHYRAGVEFKKEMDPSMSGFALFSSVIRAKAPPTLAPGTLALFGLIGLASTFRLGAAVPSKEP